MKLVEMLGHWMWIHLDVRILCLVPLKVHFEVAFRREAITAHIALEGTLTGM